MVISYFDLLRGLEEVKEIYICQHLATSHSTKQQLFLYIHTGGECDIVLTPLTRSALQSWSGINHMATQSPAS